MRSLSHIEKMMDCLYRCNEQVEALIADWETDMTAAIKKSKLIKLGVDKSKDYYPTNDNDNGFLTPNFVKEIPVKLVSSKKRRIYSLALQVSLQGDGLIAQKEPLVHVAINWGADGFGSYFDNFNYVEAECMSLGDDCERLPSVINRLVIGNSAITNKADLTKSPLDAELDCSLTYSMYLCDIQSRENIEKYLVAPVLALLEGRYDDAFEIIKAYGVDYQRDEEIKSIVIKSRSC